MFMSFPFFVQLFHNLGLGFCANLSQFNSLHCFPSSPWWWHFTCFRPVLSQLILLHCSLVPPCRTQYHLFVQNFYNFHHCKEFPRHVYDISLFFVQHFHNFGLEFCANLSQFNSLHCFPSSPCWWHFPCFRPVLSQLISLHCLLIPPCRMQYHLFCTIFTTA